MRWQYAGLTDCGVKRRHNEDAFSLRQAPQGGFIIADGLGGHQGGEIASQLAVECLEEELGKLGREPSGNNDDISAGLYLAVQRANAVVFAAAAEDTNLAGMGCTLLVACLRNDQGYIAHVGDVRAYLCRASLLTRLTTDHTEVATLIAEGILSMEEARHYPFRHRVDRAVGIAPEVLVEVQRFNLLPGDRMLFCSDGLWNMVEDHRLAASLVQESDPGSCAERLRQEALAAGGEDNITLIVVDISAECK